MKLGDKHKSLLKWALKILLTGLALYFVFTKIDVAEMWQAMKGINPLYLFLGLLAFNLSKVLSALRLNLFYHAGGLPLGQVYNLKLYYLGMFYNLFLPGSIGGDGYKVYLLKQQYPDLRTRSLVSATLLDRIGGMALLGWLAGLLALFSAFAEAEPLIKWACVAVVVLALPAWYLLLKLFFKNWLPVWLPAAHLSLWVQLSQLLSAWLLLLSLGTGQYFVEYFTLFLVSSAASVLPLTVGGAGIRELVFIYGLELMPVEKATAIAFTLLFFGITAVSSLAGLFFTYQVDRPQPRADHKEQPASSRK